MVSGVLAPGTQPAAAEAVADGSPGATRRSPSTISSYGSRTPGLAAGVDVAPAAAAELVAGPRTGASRRSGTAAAATGRGVAPDVLPTARSGSRGPDEGVHAAGHRAASPVRASVANLRLRHWPIGLRPASRRPTARSHWDLQRGALRDGRCQRGQRLPRARVRRPGRPGGGDLRCHQRQTGATKRRMLRLPSVENASTGRRRRGGAGGMR